VDITTIVVPDAAATPVNHTFNPNKIDGDTARWNEKSATHASGYWSLGISLRDPAGSNGSRVYRSQLSFAMPVLVTEVINGVSVPKVAYTLRSNVEFILPQDSTLQNRKDLRKLLVGIIDSALFKSVVEDLDHVT
jgi:hypothetical protein